MGNFWTTLYKSKFFVTINTKVIYSTRSELVIKRLPLRAKADIVIGYRLCFCNRLEQMSIFIKKYEYSKYFSTIFLINIVSVNHGNIYLVSPGSGKFEIQFHDVIFINKLRHQVEVIIINETNFWLCIQRTSRNWIKGIYSKRTGKFSKLLLFQETRQILVAVILHNK